MQTNMLDDIVVIIAKNGVWARKTIAPSIWKVATQGSTESLMKLIDDDIAVNIHGFVERLDEMIASIHKIMGRRYVESPETLFDIVMRLNEINEALLGIDDTSERLDNAFEAEFRAFHERMAPLKLSTAIETDEDYYEESFTGALRDAFINAKLTDEQRMERHRSVIFLFNVSRRAAIVIRRLVNKLREAQGAGDVNEYINILKKVSVVQQKFEAEFKNVYEAHLKIPGQSARLVTEEKKREDLLVIVRQFTEEEEEEEVEESEELEGAETIRHPHEEKAPVTVRTPFGSGKERGGLSQEEQVKREINPETGIEEIRFAMLKLQHTRFVEELKKASSRNNPPLLAAMMAKYSGQIEDVDLEGSLKLLAIAEGILE